MWIVRMWITVAIIFAVMSGLSAARIDGRAAPVIMFGLYAIIAAVIAVVRALEVQGGADE